MASNRLLGVYVLVKVLVERVHLFAYCTIYPETRYQAQRAKICVEFYYSIITIMQFISLHSYNSYLLLLLMFHGRRSYYSCLQISSLTSDELPHMHTNSQPIQMATLGGGKMRPTVVCHEYHHSILATHIKS